MSETSKIRRKAREEKQQKKAELIIKWIFGVLIALAVVFAVYSMWLVS